MERSNLTTESALYGRPPNTDDDYWIVKAILFHNGLADADPVDGLPFEPFPPFSDETRSGSIIAAVTISIFVIVSITATRLVARKTIKTSSLGWDDALISAAAVRQLSICTNLAYPDSSLGLHCSPSSALWFHTEEQGDIFSATHINSTTGSHGSVYPIVLPLGATYVDKGYNLVEKE